MAHSVQISLSQEDITLTRKVKARRSEMDTLTCLRAATNLVTAALERLEESRIKAKEQGVKLNANLKWTKPCTIKVVVDDVVQFNSTELLDESGFQYTFRPSTYKKLRIHLESAFLVSEAWNTTQISYK